VKKGHKWRSRLELQPYLRGGIYPSITRSVDAFQGRHSLQPAHASLRRACGERSAKSDPECCGSASCREACPGRRLSTVSTSPTRRWPCGHHISGPRRAWVRVGSIRCGVRGSSPDALVRTAWTLRRYRAGLPRSTASCMRRFRGSMAVGAAAKMGLTPVLVPRCDANFTYLLLTTGTIVVQPATDRPTN